MDLSEAVTQVLDELSDATGKFGPFTSAHEGYAVILEEVDELWDAIKSKRGTKETIRGEAIQVAAMALRFLHDIC